MALSTKPLLKTIHTWIGIVSGVFLSVVALTGSIILFRAEFERAAMPPVPASSDRQHRTSLDTAAGEIARVRPGAYVRRVRIPAGPDDPYIFRSNQTVSAPSELSPMPRPAGSWARFSPAGSSR